MAQIEDPKKGFQFGIIAAGLNPYAVQEANVPDIELEQVEHGDLAHDIKTAGRAKYGNIELSKLRPLGIGDNWIWRWILDIRNTLTGGGQLASRYKRNLDIVQYAYDNRTITDLWECEGAWPCKVNGIELSRTKSDNVMEKIELSVDRYSKPI